MALSLNTVTVGVPKVEAARAFYTGAFAATAAEGGGYSHTASLDLHGTGRLDLRNLGELAADTGTEAVTMGFGGHVLSVIVRQPAEVRALLEAATDQGATVVKPAKKEFFGEYTAVYRAPDGAVWKLAADTKKDSGPVPEPPEPIETAVYLGVAAPKVSKAFYEALGMNARHDYGNKFVDFTIADGECRLGLLPRKSLAKDVGVDEHGEGFSALVLTCTAASRADVDALLGAVESAGGRVTAAAGEGGHGAYAGRFTDPDGFHWCVTARA
ncbi:VOC family protein [Nocardiopsis oceani]